MRFGAMQEQVPHPDGSHPANYRCPGQDDCNRAYFAGWYDDPRPGGKTWTLPAKLGLDNSPASGGQPLTSPDGKMREVTVCNVPGGKRRYPITVKVVSNPDVFAGLKVRADTGLYQDFPNP